MSVTLEQIDAKVEAILRRMQAQETEKKPNLTITEFAKLAGVDRKTISRHIGQGRLRKVNNRISRDQLNRYLS